MLHPFQAGAFQTGGLHTGFSLGIHVGFLVGLEVGTGVGFGVGTGVGFGVGSFVGKRDGPGEGGLDGGAVGGFVGTRVGFGVGGLHKTVGNALAHVGFLVGFDQLFQPLGLLHPLGLLFHPLGLLFQPDQLFDGLLFQPPYNARSVFDEISWLLSSTELHWISELQLYDSQVSLAVGVLFRTSLQQCSLLGPMHCTSVSSPSAETMAAKPERARKMTLILMI